MYFSRIRIRAEIFRETQLARVLSDSSYNVHRLLWDLFTDQEQRTFLFREEIAREQLGTQAGVRGEPIYYIVSSTKPFSRKPLFQVETKDYQPKLKEGDRLAFELRANPVLTKKMDRDSPEKYLKDRSLRRVENREKLTKKRVRHDVLMDAQKSFLASLCEKLNLQSQLSSDPAKSEYKKVLLNHGGVALDECVTETLKGGLNYAERLRQSMLLEEKLEWAIRAVVDDALEKWINRQGQMHGFLIARDDNNQCRIQNTSYRWHSIKSDKGKKSGFSSVDFAGDLVIADVERFRNALFNGVGPAKSFGCGLMLVRKI